MDHWMKPILISALRGGTALGLLLATLAAPAGGVVVIDPVTPTTLYATLNDEELYKSTDAGVTWTELKAGTDSVPLWRLFIAPQTPTTLYGIANPDGFKSRLLKSSDGGLSWTLLLQGKEEVGASTVAIDPQTPTTLYVGVNGDGLKSRDGGRTWSSLWGPLPQPRAKEAHEPDSLVGYGVAPFKDVAHPSPQHPIFSLAIDPHVPTTLYAGTSEGVWKSTDGGLTWSAMNAGLRSLFPDTMPFDPLVLHLVLDPITPTTLYASINGIVKSADGGKSWTVLKGRWPANYEIEALALDPKTPTTLYVAVDMAGLFKSTDGGQHWTAINKGLPLDFEKGDNASLTITDIAIDPRTPTTLYVVASSNGGEGIFKSINGGRSWTFSHLGYSGLARSGEGKKRNHR
jgi:photosystem II stability/assembly factor-like uncharacterized protein